MKILVDTHTHTNCSNHAFGTIAENLAMAKKRGLQMVCMTNHAPALPDSAHIWHFQTMSELPDEVDGVRLLKGVEANILHVEGHIDIPEFLLPRMEMVVASIHRPCYAPKTVEEHTKTWINVIKNPYVVSNGNEPDEEFLQNYSCLSPEGKNQLSSLLNWMVTQHHELISNSRPVLEAAQKHESYEAPSAETNK